MKKSLAILLISVSSLAFANNCPKVVAEIDSKLSSAKGMSQEDIKKVRDLRNEGERLHKEGKHEESMKTLQEAKSMLKS